MEFRFFVVVVVLSLVIHFLISRTIVKSPASIVTCRRNKTHYVEICTKLCSL